VFLGCQCGRLRVVQELVNAGADLGQANNDGTTPLMIAAQMGKLEVVKFLLQTEVDATKKTAAGHDVLAYANAGRCADVVEFLEVRG
jgi:ankyrin repeat protein